MSYFTLRHKGQFRGWYINGDGYKMIRYSSHPDCNCSGYVPEHRLIMEVELGKRLKRKEYVHHINGNRLDNSINNLLVVDNSTHATIHSPWKVWAKISRNGKFVKCNFCGRKHYRKKFSLSRSHHYFCSIDCYKNYGRGWLCK